MSAKINDGGPAFPIVSHTLVCHNGMSKREVYAIAVMQAGFLRMVKKNERALARNNTKHFKNVI